jgi:hypothetical protein
VDDIIISRSDSTGIADLKTYLGKHFHTKDLGALRYFLGIEVARSSQCIFLSRRKYVLDLLSKTGLLGARPADTPMDSTVKLDGDHGELFSDVGQYCRLVGKLIYLTITRPDITYAVGVVSQYMHAPRQPHYQAIYHILRYLKGAPGRGLLYKLSTSLSVTGFSDADWAGNVLISGPLLAIVPLLVVILLPGTVKNRMLLLVLVLKLNIVLWLILLSRCYGFALFFVTWVLMFQLLCKCFVITKPLSLLLRILFSMSVPNILRLIVTLFEIY